MRSHEIIIPCDPENAYHAAINPDGDIVVFAEHWTGVLMRLDINTKTVTTHTISQVIPIVDMAYSHDGTQFIVRLGKVGEISSVITLDATTFQPLSAIDIPGLFAKGSETFFVVSNDDSLLAVPGPKVGVFIFDRIGNKQKAVSDADDRVVAVGFAQDGSAFATYTSDEKIKIWSIKSNKIGTIEFPTQVIDFGCPEAALYFVQAFAWTAHGNRLVTGSYNVYGDRALDGQYNLRIWNMDTGTLEGFLYHSGAIDTLALSADDRFLVAGHSRWFEGVSVWNFATKEQLYNMPDTRLVAASHGGQHILCASVQQDEAEFASLFTLF